MIVTSTANLNPVCTICNSGQLQHRTTIQDAPFFKCSACGSIYTRKSDVEQSRHVGSIAYNDDYWANEIHAARERSYAGSLTRVAEVLCLARRPIERFVDISTGGGDLLTALDLVLPEIRDRFHGVEPFPPPPEFRTQHPNYHIGFIDDFKKKFDAGTCIEVIEHLFPDVLREFVTRLAKRSNDGALYYFNSSQPSLVERDNYTYLDPYFRGHVASYSIAGLKSIFGEAGFVVHPFPSRDWGFMAEFAPNGLPDSETPFDRLWKPNGENLALLRSCKLGEFFYHSGREAIRCYLNEAILAYYHKALSARHAADPL